MGINKASDFLMEQAELKPDSFHLRTPYSETVEQCVIKTGKLCLQETQPIASLRATSPFLLGSE